jgi:hypothetical protein
MILFALWSLEKSANHGSFLGSHLKMHSIQGIPHVSFNRLGNLALILTWQD